jgi:branched-chain amino acid transport system permease protein
MATHTLVDILEILIAGAMIGCIYGLMSIGLGLIFGVMRIINFAQGDFLTLGMYATLYVGTALTIVGVTPWEPFIAAVLMSPLMFLFGLLLYRMGLAGISERRSLAEEKKHSAQLIITLGFALIIQNTCLIIFGTLPRTARTSLSANAWMLGPLFGDDLSVFINKARAVAAVVAILIVAGVAIALARTRLGKSVRAAADDPDAARYCGVDVRWVYQITFGLGTALTAVAGGLMASYQPFHPYVGLDFVVIMYAGVVLGGMGSISGAFWGGLAIGLVQQASTLILPQQLQNAAIFVIFLLILLLCPQGFFGRQSERV